MSLEKHESSYIMQPCNIISYDCRKKNGDLPKIMIGKNVRLLQIVHLYLRIMP